MTNDDLINDTVRQTSVYLVYLIVESVGKYCVKQSDLDVTEDIFGT